MPDLASKLKFLQSPQAYGDPGLQVVSLETHISWVFLVGEQVFKLKKPVRFPFLDFATLTSREYYCLEFNPQLRQIDPFDELAYLGLECALAGAPWVGERLLRGCAAALRDDPAPALIHLYTAHRALLRARIACANKGAADTTRSFLRTAWAGVGETVARCL